MGDRMKEGPLRYEQKPKKASIQRLLQNQRLEDVRQNIDVLKKLEEDVLHQHQVQWYANPDTKIAYLRFMNELKQTNIIIHQAAKATIMVRRRALEVQLAREKEQYQTELAFYGLTIHKERT